MLLELIETEVSQMKENVPSEKSASTLQSSQRLIFLDSLRGLAALIVCFHHLFKLHESFFNAHTTEIAYKILSFVSSLNSEAVKFFFVLSGFSIGLSLKDKKLTSKEVINEYYYRRLKRILPIYLIALGFTFFTGLCLNDIHKPEYSFVNFLGNLFFLQTLASFPESWFVPYGFNGPLWSLAPEFFFYCFFPIAFIVNARYLKRMNSTIKYFVLFGISVLAFAFNKIMFIPYNLFLGTFFLWFLGYLCAHTYLLNISYTKFFVSGFAVAFLFLNFGVSRIHSDSLQFIFTGVIVGSIFYFVTYLRMNIYLINASKGLVKILNGLFFFTGKGSFALYALHYPVLLMMYHYQVSIFFQLIILLGLIFVCVHLEEWAIKWKFPFLRKDYSKLIPFNLNKTIEN